MIEQPSILLSGIAATAHRATARKLALQPQGNAAAMACRAIEFLKQSQLSDRASPLCARRAGASDDLTPPRSSFDPRGLAVEAGRPANSSTADEGYCCPVCASDLAGILPCERENDL